MISYGNLIPLNSQADLFLIYTHVEFYLRYCQFQVTFQRAFPNPKFVANMPNKFSSSEIGREFRNEVRKFIALFEQLDFLFVV